MFQECREREKREKRKRERETATGEETQGQKTDCGGTLISAQDNYSSTGARTCEVTMVITHSNSAYTYPSFQTVAQ